jgi:hypothetical protein
VAHPTGERAICLIGLLTRACEKMLRRFHAEGTFSRMLTPVTDFSSAVGALTAYDAPTSDVPIVIFGHRRVSSMLPDQLPGHTPYGMCRGSNPKI